MKYQEELNELTEEISRLIFDAGKIQYEILQQQTELADINIKLRNKNLDGFKLKEKIQKEPKEVELPTQEIVQ